MHDFEDYYVDINGSGVDNELAKIVMRYGKEGKPQTILAPVKEVLHHSLIEEEVKIEEVKLEEEQ